MGLLYIIGARQSIISRIVFFMLLGSTSVGDMSDNSNSRCESINRRSVLAAGGISLAGLGTLPSLQGVSAQEDEEDYEWPIGEPDEDVEAGEWDDPLPEDPDYTDQQMITDDREVIQYSVPADWGDISGAPTSLGPTLVASPDIEGYMSSWDVPGIEVILTTEFGADPGRVLDELAGFEEFCEDGGRQRVGFPGYEFELQTWYQCGGGETMFLSMAGVSIGDPIDEQPNNEFPDSETMDAPYVVLVGGQVNTEQDMQAIQGAINSLQTRSPESQNELPTPYSDPQNGTQSQEEIQQLQARELESGQTIQGDHPGGVIAHNYPIRASAGDQLFVEVSRGGGGGGNLVIYLNEDFAAMDWVLIDADGTDVYTGQQQPFMLSGTAQASSENLVVGHSVSIHSWLYPEGYGPYTIRFENRGR
jgi:hypothetical protein